MNFQGVKLQLQTSCLGKFEYENLIMDIILEDY